MVYTLGKLAHLASVVRKGRILCILVRPHIFLVAPTAAMAGSAGLRWEMLAQLQEGDPPASEMPGSYPEYRYLRQNELLSKRRRGLWRLREL